MENDSIALELEAVVRTAVTPSRRVCEVAAMFGLGVDEGKTVRVVPPVTLRVGPGRVIFVTGASGGGKSTLLRLVREKLEGEHPGEHPGVRMIDFDAMGAMRDEPLVDALGAVGSSGGSHTLEDVVRWLSLAGLGDAFAMLRRPGELSDGQRYRLRLARAMGEAEVARAKSPVSGLEGGGLTVVLADEFGSTLDRRTAKGIARNVRKWTRRSGACFLAATTHDDLLESLEPDTLIVQHPGEKIEVLEAGGELQRHRGTEKREGMFCLIHL